MYFPSNFMNQGLVFRFLNTSQLVFLLIFPFTPTHVFFEFLLLFQLFYQSCVSFSLLFVEFVYFCRFKFSLKILRFHKLVFETLE